MSKALVIEKVSAKLGLSKAAATEAVDAVATALDEVVKSGKDVQLAPIGKFKLVAKKERNGINPRTREPITIPARKAIVFKQTIPSKP